MHAAAKKNKKKIKKKNIQNILLVLEKNLELVTEGGLKEMQAKLLI